MMKKMCVAALLLCVTAVSATAQTITAKCKTCGKPIAACPYKGRHPAAAPAKKPTDQHPSKRPNKNSGAARPKQTQGESISPAMTAEKKNLLNLVARPFGVVDNVSKSTTQEEIRVAILKNFGIEVWQRLRKNEGLLALSNGITHDLCGVPVTDESTYHSEEGLFSYSYKVEIKRADKSLDEVKKILMRIANLLGLVVDESKQPFYAAAKDDKKKVKLSLRQSEILDAYCIELEVILR